MSIKGFKINGNIEKIDYDSLDNKPVNVSPIIKTDDMTQPVGVDENGLLYTAPGGSEQNSTVTTLEPTVDDIPKIFIVGTLPTNKNEGELPVSVEYVSRTMRKTMYATLKVQGNSSTMFPKKNFTIKFYKDAEHAEKQKINFKGWGEQSKFVLKANWIDLTHSRNVVCAKLWADVVKSRHDYEEIPEQLKTSPNQGAVDGFVVRLFVNGVYYGRYTMNIPKDKWMANMDDALDTHCILCGESNIDDRALFRAEPIINESDWTDELHDSVPSAVLTSWRNACKVVYDTTDEEFIANLENHFDLQSLIDWVCFIYAIEGSDNSGKNQLFYTYDGTKWIVSLYDMDCVYGTWYDGSNKVIPYDYDAFTHYKTSGDLSTATCNLLVYRLKKLYYTQIQERWEELTSINGALGFANIFHRFEAFINVTPPELAREDYAVTTANGNFTNIPYKGTNNIQQIRQFAIDRTAFATEEINNLPNTCLSITLSSKSAKVAVGETFAITATKAPSYITDEVTWETSDDTVATVNNGVVTPVSDGSAIITVSCGTKSATCSITVGEGSGDNEGGEEDTGVIWEPSANPTVLTDIAWELGAYDGSGAKTEHAARIRTSDTIPLNTAVVSANDGYEFVIVNSVGYYNPNTNSFTQQAAEAYGNSPVDVANILALVGINTTFRIMARRTDGGNMSVSEGENVILYAINSVEWESGVIHVDGSNADNNTRIRTIRVIPDTVAAVSVGNGYELVLVGYTTSNTFVGYFDATSGSFSIDKATWGSEKVDIADVLSADSTCAYVRIIARRRDNATISVDEGENIVLYA